MTKVTNVSGGTRYFYPNAKEGSNPGGAITLDPGKSWEGDLSSAALESLTSRNVEGQPAEFQIDGDIGKAEPPASEQDEFDKMSDEELRIYIADRDGRAPSANTRRDTLLAKARE